MAALWDFMKKPIKMKYFGGKRRCAHPLCPPPLGSAYAYSRVSALLSVRAREVVLVAVPDPLYVENSTVRVVCAAGNAHPPEKLTWRAGIHQFLYN